MSQEEHILREVNEIFRQAQEQVRLAQQVRAVPSQASTQWLYRQLHEQLAALAYKCAQAQRLVGSCLTKERA